MRRALIALTLLLTLLASVACTTSTSSCNNNACSISISGEQTLDVEIGRFQRDLRVAPIEADAVTVSARGQQARLTVGTSGEVGGLVVTVTSISGKDVDLEVRRS